MRFLVIFHIRKRNKWRMMRMKSKKNFKNIFMIKKSFLMRSLLKSKRKIRMKIFLFGINQSQHYLVLDLKIDKVVVWNLLSLALSPLLLIIKMQWRGQGLVSLIIKSKKNINWAVMSHNKINSHNKWVIPLNQLILNHLGKNKRVKNQKMLILIHSKEVKSKNSKKKNYN